MSRALGIALVGRGFPVAAHRTAWSAVDGWTGVPARVVAETRCWQEAVCRPGVDIVDVCGPPPGDALAAVAAAASAGRHVVIGGAAAIPLDGLAPVPAPWAVQSGGWTVVDLPHRCVPAVSLAREIVASGDIGVLRHVTVSGPVSVPTVDLVHVITGRSFAAVTQAAGRGRLDGVLHGGCTVAVRADGPGHDTAALRVELAGSEATVLLDLQRPHTVEIAADDQVARRLRCPVPSHPYPALWGPADHPCRTRLAAEHLVVDAVEAVVRGREDVGCLDDVLVASRVLSERFEAGGEVPQRRGLLDDAKPVQLVRA